MAHSPRSDNLLTEDYISFATGESNASAERQPTVFELFVITYLTTSAATFRRESLYEEVEIPLWHVQHSSSGQVEQCGEHGSVGYKHVPGLEAGGSPASVRAGFVTWGRVEGMGLCMESGARREDDKIKGIYHAYCDYVQERPNCRS